MTYYAEIERYFTRKRGRGLMLSPKDWQVMSGWEERGIPLRVVLRGIDNSFCQKGSLKREVNFLAYCKSQVDKCWREHKKQALGAAKLSAGGQTVPDKLILQRLLALEQELQTKLAQAGPLLRVWQQAQHSLADLISLVQDGNLSSPGGLASQLSAIRQQLLEGLRANMPKGEFEQIEAAAEAELRAYRRWMLPEAYQATYEELLSEQVLKHYGLPQLRLYDI